MNKQSGRGFSVIFKNHFSRWYKNPKPVLAIAFIVLLCSFVIKPIAGFSKSIEEPVQLFEPFIFMTMDYMVSLMAVAILVFTLCDAPFYYPGFGFLAIRSRKSTCLAAQLSYSLIAVFLLAVCLLACSALFVAGNAYLANEWSIPTQILVNQSAAVRAHVSIIIQQSVIKEMTPYQALAIAFGMLLAYWWTLVLILYLCNLKWKRQAGVFIVITLHLWGMIVSFASYNPILMFSSLWHHASMSYYRLKGLFAFKPWMSCLYMLGLGILLIIMIHHVWKKEIERVLSETSSRLKRN